MDADISQKLRDIAASLSATTRIAVLSGAGISAPSGIPTFRGSDDSIWSRYRPEDLATPTAFRRDPELVWRWYDWRRGLIADSAPNAAHQALADLAQLAALTVITQNVDGYHQQAGSEDVLEFHGSIWTTRCTSCHHEIEDRRVPIPIPPLCEKCGSLTRPAVVWFGEGIDQQIMNDSARAAHGCDIFLVIGTAGAVYPAAGLVEVAREGGARVLEFNLERSAISHAVDLFVPGSAADTVPLLLP